MMKGLIFFLCLIVWLTSCKSNEIPKDVLPPEKMESVLTDILLAESFAESYLTADTTKKLKQLYPQELDRVLAVQKISQKQLRSSMDYYKTRPELLKEILDTVNNRSIREKDRIFKKVMEKKSVPKSK